MLELLNKAHIPPEIDTNTYNGHGQRKLQREGTQLKLYSIGSRLVLGGFALGPLGFLLGPGGFLEHVGISNEKWSRWGSKPT